MKAAEYGLQTRVDAAFVATNSICQGQQVPLLWPAIQATGHEIKFAHNSFTWANLASHNAGVTVVIVGISNRAGRIRTLFSLGSQGDTIKTEANSINPYLISGNNTIVCPSHNNISSLPQMARGNSPTDGGHLILRHDEIDALRLSDSARSEFIKMFVGSRELITGVPRYCIWIEDHRVAVAEREPALLERINLVRKFRKVSGKKGTVKAADWPHRFDERKSIPESRVICIPVISSENRPYLPAFLLPRGTVVSNKAFTMSGRELWPLAIICSRVNLAWVATVCARMRTDFSYTNTLGWNTLPVPTLTAKNKIDLTASAESILLAREVHFPATIGDLYDPETMPENLRAAHERNDEVLERSYIGRRFRNDTERLEKLFDMYSTMVAPKRVAG